jgi:diguanylate cyclase (GGDEF)-like protein/PAS domain S-box-containing protein
MFPVSIRYGIPLLIVVFTAVLAAYTVQKEWSAAEAFVRGEAVSDMLERMTLLQKRFSYTLDKGEHERIAQEMSLLSRGLEPHIAMLADDAAVVLGATNGEWVGRPLTEVARAQWAGWSGEPLEAIIDRVRAQFAGELYLAAAGRYVVGIYPVMLGARAGSPPAERVGVLLVQRDLFRHLAHARHTVGKHWVELTGVLAGLAVILGILIHLLVTRRLNTLLNVTQRFAAGNLEARSKLRGRDEVAILGRAFDRMAEQVADTRRQLEHRVQQRTAELGETVSELQKEIAERRRAEETLFDEKERIRVTLASIGDGVITTDVAGRVDYLNPSAERLMGWSKDEAAGQLLDQVFNIIDESSRDPVEDHMQRCFQDDQIVGLTNNTLLICRDGQERSIDHSASPIHDHAGTTIGAVLVFRDVTEAREVARQLSYHASHDALTGLFNRREFELRLERILATSAPEESHAVVYLDLDQFKVVNDTCGHVVGDELLRQVGGILAAQVRKRDTVARLGGDEFAALIEHCPQEQVLRIAHKMRAALQDFRFVWQDRGFTIGASIGVVPIELGIDTLASIFRAADSACYAAKEQGRNRLHVYKRDDQELAQRHGEMQWVLRIQEALADSRFVLFYQPIVPLDRRDRPHGEVLLRLLNRDGSLVLPSAFIPAAERYHQMQAIDRWVIHAVFATLRDPDAVPPLDCVAINVSGQSLGDRNFLEFVEQQIEEAAVPIERICFEITETAAISNLSYAMRFFSALKPRGCRFALDDFGSGLSSFAHLKSLPVDFLKIDGSFVQDMAQDPIDRAMVEAIHRIGHVMGIKTIAESVENACILTQLNAIGVNYAQGYEVGKPRPLGKIEQRRVAAI